MEIKQILGEGYDVFSLKDLDIHTEIEENGTSFEENAIIKAKAICEMTGEMVLADDSGFEVDYLNGEPGIYSARYLGEDTSYDIKMLIFSNVAKVCRKKSATHVLSV